VTGSDETLGKHQGSDERLGKRTYVTEFGLDGAKQLAKQAHERAVGALVAAAPGDPIQLRQITDFIADRSY
jgi:geranylgeranyl diphosphate synthase type II